jgi:hypothetical protein
MKYFFGILFVSLIAFACQAPKTETAKTEVAVPVAPVTLTQKWATDTLLTTCESVIYDKDHDVLYVANINGVPDGKDGNGFVSKVNLDGTIATLQWAKGMDAPKGLGIFGTSLYVADIDKIHQVDIATGKIAKTYPVEGAKFLNDITVDATGKVYASDTGTGDIILLENGKVSKFVSGLSGPNGLLAEDNGLLMVSFAAKTFNSIDLNTKQVTQKTDSIDNADGIEALGNGAYLVSSWNGLVQYVSSDFKKTIVLDTRAENINAADIEYIADKHLLLVPTFFKNKVVAYEVK